MEAQSSVSVVAPPRPPRGESATCEPQQVDPAQRPSQNRERTKAGVCARKSAATTVKEKTLKYQCVPFAWHGYAHGGSAANAAVAATGAHVIGGWTAPQGYPGQAGAAAVTPYAAAGAGTAWRPARRRDREEGPQPPPRRRARRRQRLPRYAGFGDGLLLAISFSPSVG